LRDVPRVNLAGGDLRKKRRKQDKILFADEENFVIRVAAEETLEFDDRLHAGEARTEDNDALHRNSIIAWGCLQESQQVSDSGNIPPCILARSEFTCDQNGPPYPFFRLVSWQ
jgi:hypothetical protein